MTDQASIPVDTPVLALATDAYSSLKISSMTMGQATPQEHACSPVCWFVNLRTAEVCPQLCEAGTEQMMVVFSMSLAGTAITGVR